MTNSTRCALLAKQACTTLSHVVQKITPPSANNFLKYFFTLFAVFSLNTTNSWGAEIVFKTNTSDATSALTTSTLKEQVTSGADYIASVGNDLAKVYQGKSGLKFGSSSAAGVLTLNLATAAQITNPTIIIKSAKYNDKAGSFEIFVNGNTSATATATAGTDLTFTYTGTITKIQFKSKKPTSGDIRAYLSSIKIESGSEPETPEKTETTLAWSEASYTATIDADNTFPTLTTTPADLTGVTYSSSKTDIATIAEDGAITLVAAGETTITASYAGNEIYEAATDASYTLTVNAAQSGVTPEPGTGTNVTYDFTKIDGFSSWGNSYSSHEVTYSDAKVTFEAASKQTSTITDCPVTKGKSVVLVMTDGSKLSSVKWVCKQWTTKTQTITLHYSTNGGGTYTSTGITSTNFSISSDNLPAGTNAVKITFSSTNNQVGISSCTITKVSSGSGETVASVTLTPDVKDFGTVNVGETPSQEFTITTENTTAALTASIDNTTNYAVSAITGDKVTVTYQPQSAGTHSAVLTVKAGEEATATVNLTGKAVQALEGTWILVTDASSLKAGDEIIIASKDENYALSTTQNGNNRGQVEITKTDNTITATTEAQVLTLQAGTKEGTLALSTGAGYLHAASSSDNYLRTETTLSDNSSWKVTIAADGTATLIAQGTNTRNTLYHNKSSKIFSCYSTPQQSIALYKKASKHTVTIADCTNGTVSAKMGETALATNDQVLSGIQITLSNEAATGYKLAAYDVYKTGDNTTKVTVTDGKFIMPEFDVTISATFELAKTLTGIEITNAATQTTFWQGETFNSTGLQVTAHFDGAEDEDVTSKITVTGSTATAGTQTVTVSYKEGEVTKDATYTITIKAIPNTKETAYTVADAFDIIDKLGDTDKMYITGFVSQADLVQSTIDQYKNADYWISADGSTNGQQLEAYRGKYLDNADFTSVNQIMVGDEVIIYGKLTKYGSTYEFAAGNYLVSLKRDKQQPELSYTTSEYNVNLGEAFTAPTLNNPHTLAVTYSSNNEDVATVATDGAVTIKAAGTVVITASFAGNDDYVAGEASYTITITDPALAIATLPFEFNGGLNDIVSTAGITQEGLGSDYTSDNAQNSKLKFDHTGDYIIIHFDTKPDKLMYNIKNNGFEGGKFSVQESSDGEEYSTIYTYQDEFKDTPNALYTLQATSRYVKFIYTDKATGNVGLGNIKITKLDTRNEAGLAWSTTSYNTYDGDETLAPTLTNPYGLNITYSSSNEDVATIDGAGKLTLKNTGTTTITATFEGNENYKASEVSYTLSYASKWALTYTSNVEVGNNAVKINNTEYEAIKTGTSTVHGSTKVKVPISTHTLHFHAAGWGKDEDVKLIVKNGETELGTFVLSKDVGVKNSSPFILEGTPYLQYYSVALTNITEEATITFEASTTGGERFVLYGVNQEGGVLPELDRIEIVGEAIELEYEIGDEFNPTGLSVNAIYTLAGVEHETVAVDTEDVEWSFDPVTIAAETSQVEVTATYEGKTATKTVTGLTVIIPEPEILVTPQTVSFNASQNQSIDTKIINITLKNVTSATVSLTGDGASAFNIDKTQFTESGSLTITPNTSKVGTFKAAITIADDAGVAESKKVTLTLNVTTTDNLNGTWSLITDASNLKANIKVIIASAADSEKIYTMGAQNTNNRAAIQSSVVGNTLKPELGTKVFTLVNAGDGKFAIKSINGKYLYAASSSSNHLKETDVIDVNSQWTIEINDGVATIKASDSSNRNWIRFNPNNGGTPLFSCYASGQEDICLYTTHVTVNGTTDNTSIPNQSDVTVDNAELTVTTEAEYDNMYIGGNGTVKVNTEVTVTINNLYISTTMGATTSAQIANATNSNLIINGDAFIDITLGKGGDPNQWHAFTVPFPVDAMNGVYDLNDNQLKNEVNYAIMDYHGDLRAKGQYGWKKYRGILVPGTFYLMTVDGERTTYRFKKVKGAELIAPATKELKAYTDPIDATKNEDKGWNGVGNPTLMHGKVAVAVAAALILDPISYTYQVIEASSAHFTVGTPFFIQTDADGTMTMTAETSASLAPARRAAAAVENIKVMLCNSDYTDRLYVSASEDATNEYEIGKDLGKMAMTNTPRVVQISALAYDTRLCMIDAPMANNEALVALNLYAPANGEYTLSVQAQDNEKVYLLHEGTFVWDLSMSEYPITLNKGDNAGYSILVHRADAPTSVETIDGANNQTEKLIHNGNLYILHNGKVFDAVGTMLK